MDADQHKRNNFFVYIFFLLNVLEGIVAIAITTLIEKDPKNALFLGLSKSRLLLIAIAFVVLLSQLVFWVYSKKFAKFIDSFFSKSKPVKWISWLGSIAALLLWVTIWMPAGRLGLMAALFTRLRPFLLWVEGIAFQFFILVKAVRYEIDFDFIKKFVNKYRKTAWIILALLGILALIFVCLRVFGANKTAQQYYFPPSAPFSVLQVLLSILVFIAFYLVEAKKLKGTDPKWLSWVGFLVFWLVTALVWGITPFSCSDDRLGPFAPNFVCYPSINDAVYSIGSHYITLGQGIYHHWLTDKPFYMVFLALGQWLFGQSINSYILFQIILVALFPAILFLIGKKFFGLSGGIFAGLMGMLSGENAILLFRKVSGVNVWFENPELFLALLLVLLCLVVIKWFESPTRHIYAAMAGGIFGISMLVRYNPIFIAPVLLLMFFFTFKKNRKVALIGPVVFVVAFLLAFSPWLFSAHDSNGNNYYLSKIENVLETRYSMNFDGSPAPTSTALPQKTPTVNTQPTAKPVTPVQTDKNTKLVYGIQPVDKSGMVGIAYHFLNNEFLALGIVPVNFRILSNSEQVTQPIWDMTVSKPFWKMDISTENAILLIINLFVIIMGILSLVTRAGVLGLIPLAIQVSYHLGNAFAKTSGGRYLQPVNWVTYFYFAIGLMAISIFILNIFRKEKLRSFSPSVWKLNFSSLVTQQPPKILSGKLAIVCGLVLLVGLVLPVMNNLPNQLPAETSAALKQSVGEQLISQGVVSEKQWQSFLKNPQSLVVEGSAYHARYYRSIFYNVGDPGYEVMVLGKDHVLVSYLFHLYPSTPLSDGSDVVLVGCKIGSDSLWGANRLILKSFVMIQTDHEKSIMIDKNANWNCLSN